MEDRGMATVWRETRVMRDEVSDPTERTTTSTAARIVYTLLGVINGILAIRFVLMLLGANSSNVFANFIYSITYPLVAPFFGLFNYNVQYGVVRFEFETLIAMAVYSLIAWVVVRLITARDKTVA